MLRLLLNKFKTVLILLIMGALLTTTVSFANTGEEREYINWRIEEQIVQTISQRETTIVIRVGEYNGKAGKRIYINNTTVNLPSDIPVRNDKDGKGFYVAEYDINLKQAKAIVSKLRAKGVNAHLQIANGKSEDLNAAGRIANKTNPYLYVSIHHNYFNESSTGYFAMYNPNDALGKRVAKDLANSIKDNGMVPMRENRENTGYLGELNSLNSSITGVLLELGFFSNISELENICSNKYVEYTSNKLSDEMVKILDTYYK